ncbi:MAG: hypothetical protein WD557_05760 [Dehalococcoidia bacterium]
MVEDQGNFKGNLTAIWTEMTDAGVKMPKEILAALAEEGPAYVAKFSQLFAEDPEAALRGLAAVAPVITGETVDSVIQEITGGAPGVSVAVQTGIIDPFMQGMAEKNEAARVEGRALHDAAIDAMLSDPTLAYGAGATIGGQFMAGISSGIFATQASVNTAVGIAVQGMFDYATGPEGIESDSPSKRAFIEIGVPFVQGITEGIKSPEALGGLQSALGSITNILAGASTAPFGTPNPFSGPDISSLVTQGTTYAGNQQYSASYGGHLVQNASSPQALVDAFARQGITVQFNAPVTVGGSAADVERFGFDAADAIVRAVRSRGMG